MSKTLVIALCGMAGAGKSSVTEILKEKGFGYIHLGSTEETIRRYGKTNEELERQVRLEIRKEYGMGGMAVVALPTIKKELESDKNLVIDNMYSWDEYKIFKKEFGESFVTIAVIASPAIRYKRLEVREIRGTDPATSQKRDYAELEELDKGAPIAMADYTIINEGTADELRQKVDEIYAKIM